MGAKRGGQILSRNADHWEGRTGAGLPRNFVWPGRPWNALSSPRVHLNFRPTLPPTRVLNPMASRSPVHLLGALHNNLRASRWVGFFSDSMVSWQIAVNFQKLVRREEHHVYTVMIE